MPGGADRLLVLPVAVASIERADRPRAGLPLVVGPRRPAQDAGLVFPRGHDLRRVAVARVLSG